ncbi:MAG: hypothetical protein LIO99_15025 [Clostridiales bacterium]|nr:hypothetical protein [Clostridiales bacterium]
MTRKSKNVLYYLDTISDACILFASYVISMYIRYYIMDSEPGLPILSTPYLLVAAVYSVIMASVFSYVQSGKENWIDKDMRLYSKLNGGSGHKILAVNMIGCLFLMSFFFVVGVVHFSRWALVLLWGISSMGIIIKEGIVQICLSRENVRVQHGVRTLVVGDGELAKEYLRSACGYPLLGRYVVGVVGTHEAGAGKAGVNVQRDAWEDLSGRFGAGKDDMLQDAPRYLGSLKELGTILDSSEVDEVILAMEDLKREEAERIARNVTARGMELGMVPPYSNLIPAKAPVHEFGDTRVISLGRGGDRRSQDTLWLGLVLAAALLMILLVINLFGIGELRSFAVYEDYKCIIFGIAGVFLYSYLMYYFKGRPWANTKRAVTACAFCVAASLIYEMLYTSGVRYVEQILADMKLIFISVAICWCVTGLIRRIEKDFPISI